MKKVLALGGSNSSKSINKLFASYVANQLDNVEVSSFDWNDYILPLYSPDLELQNGVHENALKFKNVVANSDALVLSLAEHNGLHSAAFKNLWDWTSRLDMKFWSNKPIFLSAVSPGGRGGANVLRITKDLMPHFGGNVITDFSFPVFYENFRDGKIVNEKLNEELKEKINLFQQSF